MGKRQSLRNKATHFVSVLLNPISDSDAPKPSKRPPPTPTPTPPSGEVGGSENGEEVNPGLADGPDTSSFTAFLYSFLSSSDPGDNANSHAQSDDRKGAAPDHNPLPDSLLKENVGRKSLFSKSKQSLGRAIRKIGGFRYHDRRDNLEMKLDDGSGSKVSGVVEMRRIEPVQESVTVPLDDLPEISEPSVLLSDSMRNVLYVSLPPLIHGRKWLLLYSTWRHGISLSTLYRRSMIWPGLSLLVQLRVNRYFTLCNTDYLAIGGGGHFALYLDGDLLNGSSSVSETYGNPCLANSEDFEVKEVELWGFVYASKYEEVLAMSRTEAPGICQW
ncbi:uncharacterized protein HKW66_Vig0060460 [Vigna angularis]|uniref:Oxidation resistance protein 1 n=1 Tax=Phaseolus angularis TaxID=3914 RepID=A0A8T0L4K0_PHAAN|nr:uncharacterized protein HKW66_Vig0060460 [Vigna angularis]